MAKSDKRERRSSREQHSTIVGDWFLAEAVATSMGRGIRQTIFTYHAPTVRNQIELFDEELEDLLHTQGIKPKSSRKAAIAEINNILKGL